MTLEMVWRNPTPPRKNQKRVEFLVEEEFGALYSVTWVNGKTVFEVVLGGTA